MLTVDRLAQLLILSWRLGSDDLRIPTSYGLLDRALRIAIERNAFPKWVHNELHFVDSRVGLQCVELPSILEWAQRAHLTVTPNPSYQFTDIQVSKKVANRLLDSLGITADDAAKWGKILREALSSAEEEMQEYETVQLEEY